MSNTRQMRNAETMWSPAQSVIIARAFFDCVRNLDVWPHGARAEFMTWAGNQPGEYTRPGSRSVLAQINSAGPSRTGKLKSDGRIRSDWYNRKFQNIQSALRDSFGRPDLMLPSPQPLSHTAVEEDRLFLEAIKAEILRYGAEQAARQAVQK